KSIRKIRRAAGAARDWDVFLMALSRRQGRAPAARRPGLDLLLGIAQGQRMAAQEGLVEETKRLDLDDLSRKAVAALDTPADAPSGYTLRDLAIPLLSKELKALEQAARGDLEDYKHLHQVRIQGKRLRYSMEVFASCFASAFQD